MEEISTAMGTSSGITLRHPEEIEKLRASNQIVVETLNLLRAEIRPGVDTLFLDKLAFDNIRKRGAIPAFKGYHGYPATICASINHELVHGIPAKDKILKPGDIITIDCGAVQDGYVGDAAVTYPVGEISGRLRFLLETTKRCLLSAIEKMREGFRLYDISHAIQEVAEGAGFNVVRDYTGHGIGTKMHEPPHIPNYGSAGMGPRLKAGMVFALEPMLIDGGFKVRTARDGWTVSPVDMSMTAHFEHSVAVTDGEPDILTAGIIWD
jgi:methionyl aminopeptidase